MEQLLHCNTDTVRRNELYLPYSVPVWDIYVILKASNWNITSKSTPVYSEKINLEVTLSLSFQGLTLFLGRDKLAKLIKN